MDYFLLFGIIGFGLLIISAVCYTTTTNKIIRDQEKEIATLKTHNRRLQAALRGSMYVTNIVTSKDPVKNPKAIVKPDFKEW